MRPRHIERALATLVRGVLATPLVLFLLVPLAALVWRAVSGPISFTGATTETLRQALVLSLYTSAISLGLIALLGTPLAYVLARHRFPGARLVDTLIDLPMVLPPAVAGLALLMAFGREGVLGGVLTALGINLAFTTQAVILAQVFVAVPFYTRAAKAAFGRVDRDVEAAAATLGAAPWRVFWAVTVPLALPGLAAGAVIAWARALGEFGATIMFAGNFAGRTQTMPLAIYGRFEAGDLGTSLLLAVVLLGTSLLILLAARVVGGPFPSWLPWRMPAIAGDRSPAPALPPAPAAARAPQQLPQQIPQRKRG